MRLLVSCPRCQRQYNATGRRIGSRFRCHCGVLVQVDQPEGHNAAVVRCSSCGAPRQEGSRRCSFCNSEFTLHERDLNTVCPQCLARVSDRARYCHHCGTGLVPELDTGRHTTFRCPACENGQALVSRRLGIEKVTVLECGSCAGLWLGPEAFHQLAERAIHDALPPEGYVGHAGPVTGTDAVPTPGKHSFYRRCVICKQPMNRRHYGRTSGVIVDVCRDHGIWFDEDELARILAWLHAGGAVQAGADENPDVLLGIQSADASRQKTKKKAKPAAVLRDAPRPAKKRRSKAAVQEPECTPLLGFLRHALELISRPFQ